VAVAAAGAAATLVLIPGEQTQAHGVNSPPSHGSAELTAFSVTSGPGASTTLAMRKGARFDPSGLRQALAQHGIPALVTVGTFCRSTPGPSASVGQVLHSSTLGDGTDVLVINGQAIPAGTRLSIGYFPGQIRLALVRDGARLTCGTTSHQPAVHILPSGTPIRG
jgi:hypothetical protein